MSGSGEVAETDSSAKELAALEGRAEQPVGACGHVVSGHGPARHRAQAAWLAVGALQPRTTNFSGQAAGSTVHIGFKYTAKSGCKLDSGILPASIGWERVVPHHLGGQEPGEWPGRAFLSCAGAALVVVGSKTPGNRTDLCGLLAVCQQLVPAMCMMLSKVQEDILLCITCPCC